MADKLVATRKSETTAQANELEPSDRQEEANDKKAPRVDAGENDVEARDVPLGHRRRGLGSQALERVREQVAAFYLWKILRGMRRRLGVALKDMVKELGLARSTVYSWRRALRGGREKVKRLGRPQRRATVAERNAVFATLAEKGPKVSVRFLKENHSKLAWRELENLVARYRRVYRRRQARRRSTLRWKEPMTVWAMDHALAPRAIDGESRAIFTVRDLGSGAQLLWVPVRSQGTDEVIAWLEALVAEHGAPLVLKEDNGSAFTSFQMAAFFERHGIEPLYSPVRRPSYNGSCEASVGAMKARTEEVAFERGRPGHWSADDLAVAVARQRLDNPLVAGDAGARSRAGRAAFRDRVAELRRERELHYGHDQAADVGALEARLVQRQAVRHALCEHGLLTTRRRRQSLPN